MTEPFQTVAGQNPSAAGNPVNRYGGGLGSAFQAYRSGAGIADAEPVPTDPRRSCVSLGAQPHAELVIRAPIGITEYTITYGRWVQATGRPWLWDGFESTPHELAGFLPIGEATFTVGAAGELRRVTWDTQGDLVGAYVSAITGSVGGEDSFAMWIRGGHFPAVAGAVPARGAP